MKMGQGNPLKRQYFTPTEQADDIRVVEIFHAGCLIQELFNLPLREAIHCLKKDKKVKYVQVLLCFK